MIRSIEIHVSKDVTFYDVETAEPIFVKKLIDVRVSTSDGQDLGGQFYSDAEELTPQNLIKLLSEVFKNTDFERNKLSEIQKEPPECPPAYVEINLKVDEE